MHENQPSQSDSTTTAPPPPTAQASSEPLTVSFFDGKTDNRPKMKRLTWPELVRRLTTHAARDEKDGPLWSPASYDVRPDTRRKNEQVRTICAAVFDYDHGPPPRNHLAARGYAHACHTTHSHSQEDPRWRVVVPLARPVPLDRKDADWRRLWLRLRAYLAPDATVDEDCKDASRMYYLPACRPGAPRLADFVNGPFLDLADVPPLSPEQEAALARPAPPVGERVVHPHRHEVIKSLAGSMRRRGMDEEEMAAALLVVNTRRCDPPIPEKDVWRIAHNFAEYPAGDPVTAGQDEPPDDGAPHPADTPGWAEQYIGPERANGKAHDSPDVSSFRSRDADRKEQSAGSEQVLAEAPAAPSKGRLLFHTAKEIGETTPEEPEWVLRPYVARGCITEVDGPPKRSGKTTFLCEVVAGCVGVRRVLGEAGLQTGAVILTEQKRTAMRASLARAGLLDREDVLVVYWHETRRAKITFASAVEQAAAECVRRGWCLLVVDTMARWAGVSGDSENQSGAAMDAMAYLHDAAGLNLAVLTARHDRKSGGEVGESGRGSNAWTGEVDVVLQLARPDGNASEETTQRVLSALSRFDETPDRLVIDYTPDGYVSLGDVAQAVSVAIRRTVLDNLPRYESVTDPAQHAWKYEQITAVLPTDARGKKPARATVDAVLTDLTSSEHGPALVYAMKLEGQRGTPRVWWLAPSVIVPSGGNL